MDLYQKISILGPSAQYDTCGPKDFGKTTQIPGVYHAKVGGNHVCRLFKVLQTNYCRNNCRYCAFRRDRDCRRAEASPLEMAQAFHSAYSRRLVEGLFLSSGIKGTADNTMQSLTDTAEILRHKYQYRGYLHLKLMPGVSQNAIRKSLSLANRISLNIEAPSQASLQSLSPDKDLQAGFFQTLFRVKKEIAARQASRLRVPSLTTQFVVGAGNDKDREIVSQTSLLYQNFGLKRVFYSAFRPIPQTPLANRPAASLTREHRLYQADFLMRFYKFSPGEIPFDDQGFLQENFDPKTAWAKLHPEFFPVNLNQASYYQLLRVPGLGPTSAKKIVDFRRTGRIHSLATFKNSRFQLIKIAPHVIF